MNSNIPPITEHHHYPAPGKCIFCNAGPGESKEHIVAYALGGNHWIRKGSCLDCAARTGAIERDFLDSPFGAAKVILGLQSRTGHSTSPTHLPVWIEKNGRTFKKKLPLNRYPLRIKFPIFHRAGYIANRPMLESMSIYTESFSDRYSSIVAGPSVESVLRRFGGNAIRWKQRVSSHTFSKMIAKIAHSQAAALGMLELVQKPSPLVPSMLGLDKYIGHWVGTSPEPFLEVPNELHVIKILADKDLGILMGEVQLFANRAMPRYEVVLGELV